VCVCVCVRACVCVCVRACACVCVCTTCMSVSARHIARVDCLRRRPHWCSQGPPASRQ
jgi:hypothetical protein